MVSVTQVYYILKTCTSDFDRSLKDILPADSIFTGMAVNLALILIVVAVYLYLSSIWLTSVLN